MRMYCVAWSVLAAIGAATPSSTTFASGTDMDANCKPVFDTYANLPHYVAGLLQRGLQEAEVAKLIGGNFLRVFAAVQAR